jgi:hypothetical protein
MDRTKRFIITLMVATIVLASLALTPLSTGAANASTTAVITPPIVGAGTWNIQTVDNNADAGCYTSLALTSTGWPAISYRLDSPGTLKYAYKA